MYRLCVTLIACAIYVVLRTKDFYYRLCACIMDFGLTLSLRTWFVLNLICVLHIHAFVCINYMNILCANKYYTFWYVIYTRNSKIVPKFPIFSLLQGVFLVSSTEIPVGKFRIPVRILWNLVVWIWKRLAVGKFEFWPKSIFFVSTAHQKYAFWWKIKPWAIYMLCGNDRSWINGQSAAALP